MVVNQAIEEMYKRHKEQCRTYQDFVHYYSTYIRTGNNLAEIFARKECRERGLRHG